MAFANFQSNSKQFNDTISQLLRLLMNERLMKKRMAGYRELEEFRQAGYKERAGALAKSKQGLEATRQENRLKKSKMDFIYKAARDPRAQQLRSTIYVKAQAGEDSTLEQEELKTINDNIAKSISTAMTTGEASQEDVSSMLALSEETFRKFIDATGATRKLIEVDKPRAATDRMQAKTARGKLALDLKKLNVEKTDEQREEWLSLIEDFESFFQQEGVSGEAMMKLASAGGMGKVVDPLSPENRGKVFEWLTRIHMKLIERKPITQTDKNFLEVVKNTHRIEGKEGTISEKGLVEGRVEGEGLPTRETYGLTPKTYEAQKKEATIAQIKGDLIAEAIRQEKITQEQARELDDMFQRMAEEKYAQLTMQR